MTTTRPNDTPPCGSGRKYKKCWELATRRSSAAVMLAVGGAIPAAIFIGVALCVLALADQRHTAFAQGAAPPDVVRAIDAFESRFNAALAQRDRTTLERLIATPFTWVHGSDGRVDSRDVWLSNASQGYALSGQRDTRSEHGATLVVYGEPTPSTAVRVARAASRCIRSSRKLASPNARAGTR